MQNWSGVLSLLLVLTALDQGQSGLFPPATVSTSSFPELVIPTEIITLTCTVPFTVHPGGVYYVWRTNTQDRTRLPSPRPDDTSQSVIFRIYEDYPSLVRVFCHVIAASSDMYLTSGYIDIEIQGLLSSSRLSSTEQNRLDLVVTPTFQYSLRALLQSITPSISWYLNDTISVTNVIEDQSLRHADSVLQPDQEPEAFYGVSSLVNGRSTLTVMDPKVDNSGMYIARISSFLPDTNECEHRLSCEELALALLTHYAVARPVSFKVAIQDKITPRISLQPVLTTRRSTPNIIRYYILNTPWSYDLAVPLVDFPSLKYNTTSNNPNIKLIVYYNGQRIVPKGPIATVRVPQNFTGTFRLVGSSTAIVTLSLPFTRVSDEGTYEIFLRIDPDIPDLECCVQNQELLTGQGLDLKSFVVGVAVVELKLATDPSLSIVMGKSNITFEESTNLTCGIVSLNGPRKESFSWYKDGWMLSNARNFDVPLVISTADVANPYGEYNCVVHNGLHTIWKDVLVSDKVDVAYFLKPLEGMICDVGKRELVQEYMTASLKATLESLCECELSDSNLFDSQVTCNPTTGVMTFLTSVAFANREGTVLASDLTRDAEQWMVGERTINDKSRFSISASDVIDITIPAGPLAIPTLVAIVVSCSHAVIVAALILECLLIRCVYVMRKKRKHHQRLKQNGSAFRRPLPVPPVPQPIPYEVPISHDNHASMSSNFSQHSPQLFSDTSETVINPAYIYRLDRGVSPMYDYPNMSQQSPAHDSGIVDMEQSGTYEN